MIYRVTIAMDVEADSPEEACDFAMAARTTNDPAIDNTDVVCVEDDQWEDVTP